MDDKASETLFASAVGYLQHLSGAISSLDDATYTRASTALPGSTIGKHVRHVLDHFNLLFAAALPPQTGTESAATREPRCEPVHYSHRVRNVSTEKDVASGMSSIEAAVERALDLQLRSPGLLEPIQVFDTLPNGKEAGFTSTLGRELWFCIHHLVHHNAVIASLMHEFGLDRPADFAYAPSTIHAQEAAKN